MAEEKPFDYTVVGYGDSPKAALADAEGKLPHPIKDPQHYGRFQPSDAVEVGEGMYKVEFGYDLAGQGNAAAELAKRKPGSFGLTDPFAVTRELSDVVGGDAEQPFR